MANRKNTFLIKRSNTPGKVPTAGDLLLGELALNTTDVILYASGTTANTILPIGWDRVARTGDTMTGALYVPYLNIKNFTGTTAVAGLAIDIDGNVITGSTFSSTFSGSTNYYSKFTSGGTLSNGIIYDNGSGYFYVAPQNNNAVLGVVSPNYFYYPSLQFYNNTSQYLGGITAYNSTLYISGAGALTTPLQVSSVVSLPYLSANTLTYLDSNNIIKNVLLGSGLNLSGGTLSISAGSGEVNTASNLGNGFGIFAQKSGVDLQFRSLSAGTNVTITSGSSVITISATASLQPQTNIQASTSTLTPDITQYDEEVITGQTTGLTINTPIGTPVNGQSFIIRIKDDGTVRTLTWDSIYRFSLNNQAPANTTINKTAYFYCKYNSTDTKWDVMWVNNF